jgi:DNA-binding NarL/FixJ family response regulator
MVGIFLVEAVDEVREALQDLLETEADFTVIATGRSLPRMSVVSAKRIPLLLIGLEEFRDFDWSALRDARRRMPTARVVFFTSETAPDVVGRALTEGAVGIIHRRASPVGFLDAIRHAAAGQTIVVPPATELDEHDISGVRRLTPREREVLIRAARGGTSREIGTALGVTERTVSAHLENAYRKLGVKTRVAAIDIARRAGQLP